MTSRRPTYRLHPYRPGRDERVWSQEWDPPLQVGGVVDRQCFRDLRLRPSVVLHRCHHHPKPRSVS
jgi:hypothetical protein